jgi:hypothetical protein
VHATESGIRTLAWSADGRHIATGHEDGTVRIWDVDAGTALVLHGHGRGVNSVAFSPDSSRVVSASPDHTARVWHTDGTGTPVVFASHDGSVFLARFSPDGRWVITSASDQTVRIWRVDGVGETDVLPGHLGYFSPDGTMAITSSREGTTRVWLRTWRGVLDRLATATTACLLSTDRQRLLDEPAGTADARAAACERAHGRVPIAELAPGAVPTPRFEPETDYEGQSFRTFELDPASPEACRQACVDEVRCRSFTLMRAGAFGPKAICYLKEALLRRAYNPDSTSGVVR